MFVVDDDCSSDRRMDMVTDDEENDLYFIGKHPNRLTAFCVALHEIAKAKLEEE